MAKPRQMARGEVLADAERDERAVSQPVLGDECRAGAHGCGDIPAGKLATTKSHRALVPLGPEDRAQQA